MLYKMALFLCGHMGCLYKEKCMAYLNLVKTVLTGGSDKYEVYAQSANGKVERIIHYKLRSNKNTSGAEGKSESQWIINDPLFPIPKDDFNSMVANIGFYLDELR